MAKNRSKRGSQCESNNQTEQWALISCRVGMRTAPRRGVAEDSTNKDEGLESMECGSQNGTDRSEISGRVKVAQRPRQSSRAVSPSSEVKTLHEGGGVCTGVDSRRREDRGEQMEMASAGIRGRGDALGTIVNESKGRGVKGLWTGRQW